MSPTTYIRVPKPRVPPRVWVVGIVYLLFLTKVLVKPTPLATWAICVYVALTVLTLAFVVSDTLEATLHPDRIEVRWQDWAIYGLWFTFDLWGLMPGGQGAVFRGGQAVVGASVLLAGVATLSTYVFPMTDVTRNTGPWTQRPATRSESTVFVDFSETGPSTTGPRSGKPSGGPSTALSRTTNPSTSSTAPGVSS